MKWDQPTGEVMGTMGLTGSTLDQIDLIGDWGLLATDADLIVTRWNRWLEQRSGLAAADVVGRPLFELFPDLITRRMDRYYRQALTGQTVLLSQRLHKYVIPLPQNSDSGATAYLQQTSRIVPLREEGDVCGTLTLVEDVTERVAYEAELRARLRQQAAVAAAARSALGGCGTVELARSLVAYVRENLDLDFIEVLERSPNGDIVRLAVSGWDAIDPDIVAAPRVSLVMGPNGLGAAADVSREILAADSFLQSHGVADGLIAPIPGRERPYGLLGVYTRTARRFPPGEQIFVQALADVLGVAAERRRLEDELRLRLNELAESDRRKDEFLAMLAHELRNPLAPVRNGLEILRMTHEADPEVNRLAKMMSRQLGQIAMLVDDLLDVSRITQGKVSLRREPVDLINVVNQSLETARPLIEARRHGLTVVASPSPIFVDADPSRLAQVIGNLLNNAAKYTDEGGKIWLDIHREGDQAIIRVRDSGIGITAEMLPRVFDLFTQINPTLDRSQGGLGIGLTLVRKLIELHGGSVHASSPGPGRGSEFCVRLPALSRSTPSATRPAVGSRTSPTISSPQRILIVDDNVDAADSLATLLELCGHKATTVYTGPAALEAVGRQKPDLVLLDIGLPGMDGYEVARRLRQNPETSGLVLVALTGYGQEDDRRKASEAGFDHHLVKPVDVEVLAKLLARLQS